MGAFNVDILGRQASEAPPSAPGGDLERAKKVLQAMSTESMLIVQPSDVSVEASELHRRPQAKSTAKSSMFPLRLFWQQSEADTSVGAKSTEKSLAALPSSLDSHLLRAVSLHEVLAGGGKHLKNNAARESDYELSTSVFEVDDFLSHDWGTRRFPKLLALLFLYNVTDASIVSALVALPVASMGAWYNRPHMAKICCPFVWAFVFMFGQRLRRAACMHRLVFLDKLCIHQTDTAKKAAGILGLAGFLRASRRLVVLWSPRYFTRLWCSYELAAWSYLHSAGRRPVVFLPVARATLVLQVMLLVLVQFAIGTVLLWDADAEEWIGLVQSKVLHLVAALAVFPLVASIVSLVKEMEQIQGEVEGYSMRDTKCYCCTHNHVHPDTGKPIPCDRRLIYTTLHEWWKKTSQRSELQCSERQVQLRDTDGSDVAVEEFNEKVKLNLLNVVRRTHSSLLVCSYGDILCAAIPTMWAACDRVIMLIVQHHGYEACLHWVLEYLSMWLFVYPLGLVATVQSAACLNKLAFHTAYPRCAHVLSFCILIVVCIGCHMLLRLPSMLLADLGGSTGAPFVASTLLVLRFLLLAFVTYRIVQARPRATAYAQETDNTIDSADSGTLASNGPSAFAVSGECRHQGRADVQGSEVGPVSDEQTSVVDVCIRLTAEQDFNSEGSLAESYAEL
eukprot:TRINITY_DN22264_c0_g2_i2.p1 TRINITY_DN22264_c0_g2~~TRINITY_DN22264_c0_g2_i2.p1  ORF type:complete len:676 (+),score=21.27 TRINITY_DN22264_c0_g2_i2:262-2289(+)